MRSNAKIIKAPIRMQEAANNTSASQSGRFQTHVVALMNVSLMIPLYNGGVWNAIGILSLF
jgi:hypothetical protein